MNGVSIILPLWGKLLAVNHCHLEECLHLQALPLVHITTGKLGARHWEVYNLQFPKVVMSTSLHVDSSN